MEWTVGEGETEIIRYWIGRIFGPPDGLNAVRCGEEDSFLNINMKWCFTFHADGWRRFVEAGEDNNKGPGAEEHTCIY